MLSNIGAECLKLIYQFLEGKITREEMVSKADIITNQQKSFPFQIERRADADNNR